MIVVLTWYLTTNAHNVATLSKRPTVVVFVLLRWTGGNPRYRTCKHVDGTFRIRARLPRSTTPTRSVASTHFTSSTDGVALSWLALLGYLTPTYDFALRVL